jgi:hypothetical protein
VNRVVGSVRRRHRDILGVSRTTGQTGSIVVKHPFNYEITNVAVVAIEPVLHDRLGEAAEATPRDEAVAP